MSQVNTELGYSSTATISLNDAAVRSLAGVPSGAISMQNLQGKSSTFSFTIGSNQTNADLRSLAVSAGWNQSSAVIATISSGVYISSNSTGTYALTVSGSFPGGVTLNNSGIIVGMGGSGGRGAADGGSTGGAPGSGAGGGPALYVSTAVTIYNYNTIAGGGGGGGGGGSSVDSSYDGKYGATTTFYVAGSGGGGGRSSLAANSSGGAAGTANSSYSVYSSGNPGNAGTVSSAGSGGSAKQGPLGNFGGAGGGGGGWGSSGSGGSNGSPAGIYGPAGGGGGGNAVVGNSNITWGATGTRLGGIS